MSRDVTDARDTKRGDELLTGGSDTDSTQQFTERDIQLFVAGYRARELDTRWDDRSERIARRKARKFLDSPRWQHE